MEKTFFLEIVTPYRKFFSGYVEEIIIQSQGGQLGVLKDHAPMVITVDIGPVKILRDGEWLHAVLSEGFMKVMENKTTIICDSAEWPHEIDINRAKAAEERARERLQHQLSKEEYARTQSALQRALSRLKLKGLK
jgi:F-type H+-transporting ATPase subunit epsilon